MPAEMEEPPGDCGHCGEAEEEEAEEEPQRRQSWLRRTILGRTPSLPSTLGKRKQSFFKVGTEVVAIFNVFAFYRY